MKAITIPLGTEGKVVENVLRIEKGGCFISNNFQGTVPLVVKA